MLTSKASHLRSPGDRRPSNWAGMDAAQIWKKPQLRPPARKSIVAESQRRADGPWQLLAPVPRSSWLTDGGTEGLFGSSAQKATATTASTASAASSATKAWEPPWRTGSARRKPMAGPAVCSAKTAAVAAVLSLGGNQIAATMDGVEQLAGPAAAFRAWPTCKHHNASVDAGGNIDGRSEGRSRMTTPVADSRPATSTTHHTFSICRLLTTATPGATSKYMIGPQLSSMSSVFTASWQGSGPLHKP
mmetsp:Transcript_99384/g.290095  ORF Transcript_99384/g.290095 Transcript_99384/m.290095 type:complete len:246 (-) Transcript_99384:229-966(-)